MEGVVEGTGVFDNVIFDGELRATDGMSLGNIAYSAQNTLHMTSAPLVHSGTVALDGTLSVDDWIIDVPADRGEIAYGEILSAIEIEGEFAMTILNGIELSNDQSTHIGDGIFVSLEFGDANLILATLLSSVGDVNGDQAFDSSDLVKVFQAGEYEDGFAENSTWVTGDWNGDREFDSGDLVLAFQEGTYEGGAAASIPEPSSMILMLLGILMAIRHQDLSLAHTPNQ